MPRGDRTGPAGLGPMTGRGGGYCAGSGLPGFNRAGWGSLFGPGASWGGSGRRFCRWFFGAGLPAGSRFAGWGVSSAESNLDLEKQSLKGQAETLEYELERIKKRLQEMEAGEASG